MELPPQPPADIEARELPMFFRIGAGMLIPGSVCTVGLVLALAEALKWGDFAAGLRQSYLLIIPPLVFLIFCQIVIALTFMTHRHRAWWRTCLVLLPAVLLAARALGDIASLYPHERRARKELARFLGGPLPASASAVELDFRGGIIPSWHFEFQLDPRDYPAILGYRHYASSAGRPSTGGFRGDNGEGFTAFPDYDSTTSRCTFSVIQK